MARMLNPEETAKLESLARVDCTNCPRKSTCAKKPEDDMSQKAILKRMDFGCDLIGQYTWEVVYGYHCDSKYGRYAVNWEKGWKREPTFEEFYGGSVID